MGNMYAAYYGDQTSTSCAEPVCEVPVAQCEPKCAPTFCTRVAWPFVGALGWVAYILEAVVIIWVSLMLIGVVRQDPYIILGLLLGIILVDFVFWIGNIFWCAPSYATSAVQATGCAPADLIVRDRPYNYACKVAFDLKHGNDQAHLQTTILGGLFTLLLFGIFVGVRSVNAFNTLPAAPTGDQIMLFVIAKALEVMIIAAIGMSFHIHLTETHSDFMWRHLTAINEQYKAKNEGETLALGKQSRQNNNNNYGRSYNDNSTLSHRKNVSSPADMSLIAQL
jgi:hypothetical protein